MGISVAIVGVGQFGWSFIRLFRDHPGVDRLALCDLNATRLAEAAKEFGVAETYASLDEVCRSDLDAVAIFTQPWLHAPQAVAAMEAGKCVYSAVPVVMLPDGDQMLEWCDRVIDTSRRTGKHYMMGETSHYRPQAMFCRRKAAEGAFGRFILAEGEYFHDFGHGLREVYMTRWGKQWNESKRGDIPMHYPTHSLGGFLSVIPARVTQVAAVGFALPGDDWYVADGEWRNTFSDETALMKLSDGSAARVCEFRRVGHVGREGFQIFGTDASFVHHLGPGMWMVKGQRIANPTVEEMRDPLPADVLEAYRRGVSDEKEMLGGHGGSHAYLVNEFVDAVARDRAPAVNAWHAARLVAPGVIAHKSAQKDGEWMSVPDWGDPPA